MESMKLTHSEKDAIRNSPCGRCGRKPPFKDGSRCHPHKLDPDLGYTHGNVVPRCPSCHRKEHVGTRKANFITSSRLGGLRRAELRSADELSAWGRKGGLVGGKKGGVIGGRRVNELYPEITRANFKKGWDIPEEARRSIASYAGKKTQRLHPHVIKNSKWRGSPKHAAAAGRKGGLKGGIASTHIRWHVRRGKTNPDCPLCQKTQPGV